ncbi:hypothetical protein ACE939_08395 [Aquimarina sp. W85]|uniref:hypothetical protein n=1 Tax=Aquimarina rhodophyticola TaxID=3342246 RepID=UPI00366C847C
MKNAIGKPYERKVYVRFDEGGTDNSRKAISLIDINRSSAIRRYPTLQLGDDSILVYIYIK